MTPPSPSPPLQSIYLPSANKSWKQPKAQKVESVSEKNVCAGGGAEERLDRSFSAAHWQSCWLCLVLLKSGPTQEKDWLCNGMRERQNQNQILKPFWFLGEKMMQPFIFFIIKVSSWDKNSFILVFSVYARTQRLNKSCGRWFLVSEPRKNECLVFLTPLLCLWVNESSGAGCHFFKFCQLKSSFGLKRFTMFYQWRLWFICCCFIICLKINRLKLKFSKNFQPKTVTKQAKHTFISIDFFLFLLATCPSVHVWTQTYSELTLFNVGAVLSVQ